MSLDKAGVATVTIIKTACPKLYYCYLMVTLVLAFRHAYKWQNKYTGHYYDQIVQDEKFAPDQPRSITCKYTTLKHSTDFYHSKWEMKRFCNMTVGSSTET